MRMALNQQQHPLYDNSWPVAMQPIFRSIAIFHPRRTKARYHTDCHLLSRTHNGRFMSLHGTVMASYDTSIHQGLGQGTTSVSQRLPSESLKFTKVWAKVPPKCLKGWPLSHLGSPRFGPRYHLSVSNPSETLKFTKVWAKVPPKCLKACPLSHLSSPRFGPRYHLSASKLNHLGSPRFGPRYHLSVSKVVL